MARNTPPLPLHNDADYVQGFEALSLVERQIRRCGPDAESLLRRSMLQAQLGNLAAALDAAQDAVAARPSLAEAHFQEGICWLLAAKVSCGRLALGPGTPAPPSMGLRDLLTQAYSAFCAVLQYDDDDPDAEAEVAWLEHLLELDADGRRKAFCQD